MAQLSWITKSHDYASVIAVKSADNIYDLYINNCSTYSSPRIYHFSSSSNKFKWNVGSWTTTKPTAAYTASDVGRVYYATNAGNADTATTAVSAGSATKATQDGNGKVIASTYLPLSGGTLTGALEIKTNVDRSLILDEFNGEKFHVISFRANGEEYAYLGANYLGSENSLQFNGSTILHAGNFTSYAPSLTGSGASGT